MLAWLSCVLLPVRFPVIGNWFADGSKKLSRPGLLGFGGFAWGDESIKVSRFDVPEELEGESLP